MPGYIVLTKTGFALRRKGKNRMKKEAAVLSGLFPGTNVINKG